MTIKYIPIHYRFGMLFVIIALICDWQIFEPSSLLYQCFYFNVFLPNIWGQINIIPFAIGSVISGNVHQPITFVLLLCQSIQWFILGLLFSKYFPFHKLNELFKKCSQYIKKNRITA
jgi:hypothetical protein